ncbi:MAG: OmpA/MotB family protein, partial [Paracoccaceae bacterium]
MLMWLLNATTEKQRKGIADYFNPTIPINRISGGGDGAFGGDSVFSEETLTQSGTGATLQRPTESDAARGETGSAADEGAAAAELAEVEQALLAWGGESMTMEQLLRHVVTRVTDEGLVIELFDLPDAPLFDAEGSAPTPKMQALMHLLADVLAATTNEIAVNGYVRAHPITLIDNPVWPLSSSRAQAARVLLGELGMPEARIQRVTGYADRMPVTTDPVAIRNNRIEIVLLRRDR